MLQTIEHLYEVPAERLWQVYFFDEAYAAALAERLRLRVVASELHYEGAGPTLTVHRRRQLAPERELPLLLARLLGTRRTVLETVDFSAARRRYTLKLELPVIASRVALTGEYTWEEAPAGALRRVWRGRCDARVPVLGPALERYLMEELEVNLSESHAFMRRWLREHPADAQVDASA